MTNIKLSCIIPSYRDPLLQKTINDLIENSELWDALEIIAVLDWYWPEKQLEDHPRVRIVHLGKNRWMRWAINAGVSVARWEFLMRVDEHQRFGKWYDRILTETCESNWIVTPKRFFLDPVRWEVMDIPPVETAKLVIAWDPPKFSWANWYSRDEEFKDEMLVETMAMQGSCWVMPRKWWDEVIWELDTETYWPLNFDSHEMVFKTWQAGWKLMLNKNTWHAHKHRDFKRTHNNWTKENPANLDKCFANSIAIWNEYYQNTIRPKWKI